MREETHQDSPDPHNNGGIPYSSCFQIGGVSVQLQGDNEADVSLVSSLESFRVGMCRSDIEIRVEWVRCLRPDPGPQLFDSGTTWEVSQGERGLQFDFCAAMFGSVPFKRLYLDSSFRLGTLEMNEECLDNFPNAVAPLGYPLDELLIMHRLTQEKAIELHGTGIVRPNGEANLFVGHSGAGKSTTTRLWTDVEEVEVLSDDRIIVRRDKDVATADGRTDGSGENIGIPRLRDRSALPTGHFAQDDKTGQQITHFTQNDKKHKMRMYGTPWHGEAMFASPNSAPLTRIFVLEHGHGNVITRLSPSQAVAELFARSFVPFHRHEYVDSALVFLEELVGSVPVYRYSFEPDQRAVDKILTFHD
jgi:hypothetical protein